MGCGHAFCHSCMRRYVRSRLTDGAWRIRCPGERCAHLLVEKDMVKLLFRTFAEPPRRVAGGSKDRVLDVSAWESESRALLDRYRELQSAEYGSHLRDILRTLPGATAAAPHGAVPVAGRENSGKASAGAGDVVVVPVYETPVEEADAVPMQSFESWAVDACQACPRCLVVIRKEVGCDHMRCLCGEEFCYGCGAPCNIPAACVCGTGSKQAGLPRLARWLLQHRKLDLAGTCTMQWAVSGA